MFQLHADAATYTEALGGYRARAAPHPMQRLVTASGDESSIACIRCVRCTILFNS